MWQSHNNYVEHEHYSYHILTPTISTLHGCNSAVESPRKLKFIGFSNFNLSARGEPTSGFHCQSIVLGELIEFKME